MTAPRLAPAPAAQAFLAAAIEAFGGEYVQIVTARPEHAREMTLDWLHAHGFPRCAVIFADDKVPVAGRLGVSHAVEDSLRHARCYAAAGIRCLLLSEQPPEPDESPLICRLPDLGAAR